MRERLERKEIEQVTDIMSCLYDELVIIFGKSDSEIRHINKILRDLVSS